MGAFFVRVYQRLTINAKNKQAKRLLCQITAVSLTYKPTESPQHPPAMNSLTLTQIAEMDATVCAASLQESQGAEWIVVSNYETNPFGKQSFTTADEVVAAVIALLNWGDKTIGIIQQDGSAPPMLMLRRERSEDGKLSYNVEMNWTQHPAHFQFLAVAVVQWLNEYNSHLPLFA